jgi:isoquinoline 1-oxidoreductase beta subunit
MLSRRRFFLGSAALAGATGALVVGWSFLPPRQRLMPSERLPVSPGQTALNGWVKVSADSTITIMMSQCEMGQGAHTGLAMLLADEMDADWAHVRLEQSTFDGIYNNQAAIVDSLPFQPDDDGLMKRGLQWLAAKVVREIPGAIGTGGSSSVKDQWLPLREAGASARAALIAAAAELWQVRADECRTESGRVLHPSGKSAAFGELAARAAQLPLPRDVALKEPAQFKLIGKPVRRIDNAAKLDGSATYAIDAQPPGLLYASVMMCPTLGGKVNRFDGATARSCRGCARSSRWSPTREVSAVLGRVRAVSRSLPKHRSTPCARSTR